VRSVEGRTNVAIALGSNLGDRRAHLLWAVERLASRLGDLRVSTLLETEPEGVDEPQPPYLNAVVVGRTSMAAPALLGWLLSLEEQRGRKRPSWRAPRTLDLDLVFYGDLVTNGPGLAVPHPRFRERRFVLQPLAEVAGDWCDPVTGLTVRDLLARLPAPVVGEPAR
jgi:2-amino-4-hydroxy-6-hydroxymethyldihydropteridine diphosphokinase